MVLGLFVNVGAHLALPTGAEAGTETVQFIQLDKVPAFEVALTAKEYDPAAVGVPDITLPDQEAHTGFVTSDKVEDSFTVGVYE